MKVDVHFTTCHHSTVRCRDRYNNGVEGFNIKSWTPEEKLEIAKISLKSLADFTQGKVDRVSVLDDGSDNSNALEWLDSIKWCEVFKFPHRGSSQGINDYHKTIEADLVCHFEDDHVYYNPLDLDWSVLIYDFLINNPNVGVVTLISGLPCSPDDPGFRGKWGPIGMGKYNGLDVVLYRAMGNAHHIMLKSTYDKFFPLQGNTGGCEEYMNQRLESLGLLNAVLQIPVYAFHSHRYELPLPESPSTCKLNMTGRGIEYGIKDMYGAVKNRTKIDLYLTNEQGLYKYA